MTAPLQRIAPPPPDAAYREQLTLSARNGNPQKGGTDPSPGRSEDVVTISSERPTTEGAAAKLKPSQPVTHAEKHALQSGFSIYG